MIRSLALTLAASLVVACSQSSPPQSAATGQAATATPPAQSAPGGTAPAPNAAQPAEAPAASASAPASPPPAPAAAQSSTGVAARPTNPASEPPAAPTFREVTVPAGTSIRVKVLNTLASDTSKVEDPVKGAVDKPVVVSGATAIPAGSDVAGSVIEANESGRVKGKASLAIRFDRLTVRGETHRIQTARVAQQAAQDKKQDVKKGGIGAGVGAIVGGVVGGGKGAAIGAVAGGAGTVMATKGNEVHIAPGTVLTVLLQEPLTVSVPVK